MFRPAKLGENPGNLFGKRSAFFDCAGCEPGTDLQCVSSKLPKLERKCAAGRAVTNRFETIRCQACDRGVKRKSRQQRFCSDRCRNYAHRNSPSQINGRTAIKNASGYLDSGRVTNPLFLSNKNNGLQGQKSGLSIPLNLLGGHHWPNAVGVEPDLLRKIIGAEVGGLCSGVTGHKAVKPSAPHTSVSKRDGEPVI
ncbi:MAG: hypothetical protein WAK55_01650, partial [Xanthobacteraceae bacterium]